MVVNLGLGKLCEKIKMELLDSRIHTHTHTHIYITFVDIIFGETTLLVSKFDLMSAINPSNFK